MVKVKTKTELHKAIGNNENEILIDDTKLIVEILSKKNQKPLRNRLIFYAMINHSYKIIERKSLGAIEVRFEKDIRQASSRTLGL